MTICFRVPSIFCCLINGERMVTEFRIFAIVVTVSVVVYVMANALVGNG